MAGMGGCTAVFFYLSPVLGASMIVASIAVAWSRIYLRQHTLLQVLLGWAVPVVTVIIVFALYDPFT